jgi:hypothetical protein
LRTPARDGDRRSATRLIKLMNVLVGSLIKRSAAPILYVSI